MPSMTTGCRLARAEYKAPVSPAGPEPRTTTLRVANLEMLVDDLLQVILLGEADDGFDDLAPFEEQQCRDAANLEREGGIWIVVHVQLAHRHFAGVIGRQRIDGRRQALAGPAPFGPEIHQNRVAGLQHGFVEIGVSQNLYVFGCHVSLYYPILRAGASV